ncbi:plbA, partial [Symbiodinium sp. KB8]
MDWARRGDTRGQSLEPNERRQPQHTRGSARAIVPGMQRLAAVLWCATLALATGAAPGEVVWTSAVRDARSGNCCTIAAGKVPGAVAVAGYTKGVETTGWDVIQVETAASASPADAGYAAGLLEGSSTQARIYAASQNFAATFFKGTNRSVANDCVLSFVDAQWAWLQEQARVPCSQRANATECRYWDNVLASVEQARGVYDGYVAAAPAGQHLSWQEVYQLANGGDLEDLLRAFPDSECHQARQLVGERGPLWKRALALARGASPPEWRALRGPDMPESVRRGMSCSGFVRLVPEAPRAERGLLGAPRGSAGHVLTGHTTFNDYQFMLRVFKVYTMRLPGARAETTSFSARPGDLHSKDDWYALTSNLTVIETSLTVFDRAIYKALRPGTVPCWIRVSVANRLAGTAEEWAGVFAAHASGTHNNDWIATDYNAALRGDAASVSWRVNEMPGLLVSWDATPALRADGILYSVNIPNDTRIFRLSGYNRTGFNFTEDPRARIFRRDGPGVRSQWDLRQLMISNNYKTDPISAGHPCNAISARCDLPPSGGAKHSPYAFGGIDAKVIGVANLTAPGGPVATVQSSPTHETQPVFDFAQWDN